MTREREQHRGQPQSVRGGRARAPSVPRKNSDERERDRERVLARERARERAAHDVEVERHGRVAAVLEEQEGGRGDREQRRGRARHADARGRTRTRRPGAATGPSAVTSLNAMLYGRTTSSDDDEHRREREVELPGREARVEVVRPARRRRHGRRWSIRKSGNQTCAPVSPPVTVVLRRTSARPELRRRCRRSTPRRSPGRPSTRAGRPVARASARAGRRRASLAVVVGVRGAASHAPSGASRPSGQHARRAPHAAQDGRAAVDACRSAVRASSRTCTRGTGPSAVSHVCASHRPQRRNVTSRSATRIRISIIPAFEHRAQCTGTSQSSARTVHRQARARDLEPRPRVAAGRGATGANRSAGRRGRPR